MVQELSTLLEADRFRVTRVSYKTDAGVECERDVIRHPGAVTIVPLLGDNRVCLIENTRPAVNKTLIELPAGTLEPNEDPIVTAGRELIEETGYKSQSIRHLHSFFLSPGILDERMHLFVATDLIYVGSQLEAGEQIVNKIVTIDEALEMVRSGKIEDAKTIVGLTLALAISNPETQVPKSETDLND